MLVTIVSKYVMQDIKARLFKVQAHVIVVQINTFYVALEQLLENSIILRVIIDAKHASMAIMLVVFPVLRSAMLGTI